MAFKTFTAGSVLTASEINTYLMGQSIIACTSATRPSGPAEGMMIYETDTDLIQVYNGTTWYPVVPIGDWTAYTPTVSVGTLGDGTITAHYAQLGAVVHYRGELAFGATTKHPDNKGWQFSLPVNKPSGFTKGTGTGLYIDASTGAQYPCTVLLGTSQVIDIVFHAVSGTFITTALFDESPAQPVAAASGDSLFWDITYRAA
jgi:hypothetical protein